MRESICQDRPQTRSITRKVEEHVAQKPRLNDYFPTLLENTLESMLTEQSGTGQEFLSPLHHYRETTRTTETSPHRVGSIFLNLSQSTMMAFSYPRFNGDTDVEGHP